MERIDKIAGTFDRREPEGDFSDVPTAVVRRLPRYYRYLGELLGAGELRISSARLSALMGVTASQIRQDLNCFGGFGQQGYGYNIPYLHRKIGELLGVEAGFSAVVVGAGNLGQALVSSRMFERRGVRRLALFDIDPAKIGTRMADLCVLPYAELGRFCRDNHVTIGVLTTPKEAAADVAHLLAENGVRGIWNFTNTELSLPGRDVCVENIHLADSLMKLCYELKVRTLKEDREA